MHRTLLITFLILTTPAWAQVDPGPDGIGIYFDEAATQVSLTADGPAETVEAYLILTNPTQEGTLAMWSASVGPLSLEDEAMVQGTAVMGFNMASNMPGDVGYFFTVGMDHPYPELTTVNILANLQILLYTDGPVRLKVGGHDEDSAYYRVDDFYTGIQTVMNPSSGSQDLPVAVINGPAPVAEEHPTWDQLKAQYR